MTELLSLKIYPFTISERICALSTKIGPLKKGDNPYILTHQCLMDSYAFTVWTFQAKGVPGPEVIKLFLCSTQFFIGILTFMSWKNSILGLPEPEKC